VISCIVYCFVKDSRKGTYEGLEKQIILDYQTEVQCFEFKSAEEVILLLHYILLLHLGCLFYALYVFIVDNSLYRCIRNRCFKTRIVSIRTTANIKFS